MRRVARALGIGLSIIGILCVALLYPFIARGDAWFHVVWLHPWSFLLLLGIPLALFMATVGADDRAPRLLFPTVFPFLKGPKGWRASVRYLPGIFRSAALILAIAALARPQNVLRGEQSEERGIDIVIVLDLSGSMRAVMDGATPAPGPSVGAGKRPTRLDAAKEVISDFLGRRRTDRIGVVVFGRNAYVLSPPTLDYALVTALVQKMDLDVIDGNGTAIGDALGVGVARLRRSNALSKAIVLITDGDSNAGEISPEYASYLAQTQGVLAYTVQIGNGDEVDVQDGVDLFGQPHYGRFRFPVNPELLKKIASNTGGEAYVATDKKGLEQSMHEILNRLEKTRFLSQSATMEDLFPFLLLPATVLLVLEAWIRVFLVRRFP